MGYCIKLVSKKDISELYLKHINKLGGIKYESND